MFASDNVDVDPNNILPCKAEKQHAAETANGIVGIIDFPTRGPPWIEHDMKGQSLELVMGL